LSRKNAIENMRSVSRPKTGHGNVTARFSQSSVARRWTEITSGYGKKNMSVKQNESESGHARWRFQQRRARSDITIAETPIVTESMGEKTRIPKTVEKFPNPAFHKPQPVVSQGQLQHSG
jgi:hypothetical protein